MIKFFRKIRQKLLSENKLSRYLLYAIGEIILVVIGILIALQINNWNENRKQNNRKVQLMKDLKVELQRNNDLLNVYVHELHECNSKFNKVLFHSAGDSEIPEDSLRHYLSNIMYGRTLSVVNSVQEEAINSGKFELLNDSLKASLSLLKDYTNSRNLLVDKGLNISNFSTDNQTAKLIAKLYMTPVVPDEYRDHQTVPLHPEFELNNQQLSELLKEPDTYLKLKSIYLTSISDEVWIKYGILRVTNQIIEIINAELVE